MRTQIRVLVTAGILFSATTCFAEDVLIWTLAPQQVTLAPGRGASVGRVSSGDRLSIFSRKGKYAVVMLADGATGWVRLSRREARRLQEAPKTRGGVVPGQVEPPLAAIRTAKQRGKPAAPPVSPLRIVVSLEGLTCHVSAPSHGVDEVYPVGVGVVDANGRSITPTCADAGVASFYTHPDPSNQHYYIAHRRDPEYFGGFPFVRLDISNENGYHTYGMHGPISRASDGAWELRRGYVSHGCIRMRPADVQRIFELTRGHPPTPVLIQQSPELDAKGQPLDVEYPRWPAGPSDAAREPGGAPAVER